MVERGIVSSFQYWKEGRAYFDALLSRYTIAFLFVMGGCTSSFAAKLDKMGRVLEFSLSIIHGPSAGLSFAVQHPHTLPRIFTKSDFGSEESSNEEDEDDYDTEPPVIEQDAEPNALPDTDLLEDDDCKRPFILEDDDADDDAKSSAIKQLSKNPRNLSQLKDRSNDGGTKTKTKTQLTLLGQRAGPLPKKLKTTKTYVFSGKPIPPKPKN